MRPLGTILTQSLAATLGLGPRAAGAGLLLRDTFTGPDGTVLPAHPMEIGAGWTIHQGGAALQSNRAKITSLGPSRMTVTAPAGRANATAGVVVNSGGTSLAHGLLLRFQDTANYWLLYLTATNIALYEMNGGSFIVRAQRSLSMPTGVDHQLQAVCAGTVITATVNGGNQIQYAAATHVQSADRFGLYGEQVGQQYDQFEVRS